MSTDLFGNKVIKEESFSIVYKGSSFVGGRMLISSLHTELKSLENLIKDSFVLLNKTGKIGLGSNDFKIYIEMGEGSVYEKVKIIFGKKTTIAIIGTFLIPFLNTTYSHFLSEDEGEAKGIFEEEIQQIESDQNFKKNLKNILSPLNNNDDNLLINNGEINITINYDQKETIDKNIESKPDDEEYKKNGEFNEELTGVIRKLDLDASQNNYFGFNIKNGPSKIPTSIKGEFNLLDYKDIIDAPIKIKAIVRYKDNIVKHIEVESYEVLEKPGKQEKINF